MAEREPEQEFTGEDFKRLLFAGLAAAKRKGGELFSRIGHEIDPDVRTERYLQRKYAELLKAGIDPEHAKKVVKEHVENLLKKEPE